MCCGHPRSEIEIKSGIVKDKGKRLRQDCASIQ